MGAKIKEERVKRMLRVKKKDFFWIFFEIGFENTK